MKYKGSMLRRGILTGAMVLAGAGATVAAASAPAGASNTQMTVAGSATTFFMVHALFPAINDINPNPEEGSETQSIAADSETCSGGVQYTSSSVAVPPNGSGAGKKALAAEETAASNEQGCIDFSRSSSPPAPASETLELSGTTESGDPSPSSLDYYAYALDGVGPLVGSDAPTSVRAGRLGHGRVEGLDVGPGPVHFRVRDHQLGPDHRQRSHGFQRTYRVVLATGGVWDAGRHDRCPRVRPHQVWGVALSLHLDHPADHRIRARRGIRERREHPGRHHLREQHR